AVLHPPPRRDRPGPLDRAAHRLRPRWQHRGEQPCDRRRPLQAAAAGARRCGRCSVSATRRALRVAGALATAAVLLLLGWLEAGRLPGGTAQRASDVLQLGIACFASLACLAAAARPGARAFWAAFGLGCAAWAA